jgi:type II secretory pathway component PulM
MNKDKTMGKGGGAATGAGALQAGVAGLLERLSSRERVMIVALVCVAVICALAFLVVMPGLARIDAQEQQTQEAEAAQASCENVIAQVAGLDAQIEKANAAYDASKGKLYTEMKPEALDAAVTKYVVDAGFDPQSLQMSQLGYEAMPAYVPQAAVTAPEDGAATAGGAATGTDGSAAAADADAGSGDAATEQSAGTETAAADAAGQTADAGGGSAAAAGSIGSYTTNVTVKGSLKSFYKLLDRIEASGGVALTQYSCDSDLSKGAKDAAFTMTIVFYVYADGGAAS